MNLFDGNLLYDAYFLVLGRQATVTGFKGNISRIKCVQCLQLWQNLAYSFPSIIIPYVVLICTYVMYFKIVRNKYLNVFKC